MSKEFKLYHLSSKKLVDLHFYPRIPKLDTDVSEDTNTKRICLSKSILGCLRAMPFGIEYPYDIDDSIGKTYYVYNPINLNNSYLYYPTEVQIPDVKYTEEVWYLKDCYFRYLGSILITEVNKLNTLHKSGFDEDDNYVNDLNCKYIWLRK